VIYCDLLFQGFQFCNPPSPVAGAKLDQFTAGQQVVAAGQVQVEKQLLFERSAGALARETSMERAFQISQAMGVPGPSLSTVSIIINSSHPL
jgi:hypothetical protein